MSAIFWSDLSAIANLVLTLGIVIAIWQALIAKKHEVVVFEDALNREYREIVREIPADIMLGQEVNAVELLSLRENLYRYFDLTNEQIFLRTIGRVSDQTWAFWRDGIRTNLRKHAFSRVWETIKSGSPDSFMELRRLEASGFADDPARWTYSSLPTAKG